MRFLAVYDREYQSPVGVYKSIGLDECSPTTRSVTSGEGVCRDVYIVKQSIDGNITVFHSSHMSQIEAGIICVRFDDYHGTFPSLLMNFTTLSAQLLNSTRRNLLFRSRQTLPER